MPEINTQVEYFYERLHEAEKKLQSDDFERLLDHLSVSIDEFQKSKAA